jgi:hydrogenase/urease accessory protein HupE
MRPDRRLHRRAIAWLVGWVAWCLTASLVHAHTGGLTGLATLTVRGEALSYAITFNSIPPGPVADRMRIGVAGVEPDMRPLLEALRDRIVITSGAARCLPGPGEITASGTTPPGAKAAIEFRCPVPPAELTIRDDMPAVMGDSYHALMLVTWSGGSHQFAFGQEAPETKVRIDADASAGRGAGSFFPLGIEHILTGYDHLLFLLALILRGGNLIQVLKIVTAFTIAHSVTLALAALDVVALPGALVEAAIALSIAYVAAENLMPRFAVSRRWAVSFLFGLIHGFGFSSVLREIGLPQENLVLALLNFNLGVEAGQAAVVVLVLPILLQLRRRTWEPKLVAGISSVILVVGLWLFVDRAFLGG